MAVEHVRHDTSVFRPIWPSLSDEALRSSWRSYDLASDTLMIYLGGKSVPAVSVLVGYVEPDSLYLRTDVTSDAVVGVQFEEFLTVFAPSRPQWFTLLNGARLHGITTADLGQIRRALGITETDEASTPSLEVVLRGILNDLKAERSPIGSIREAPVSVIEAIKGAASSARYD